MINNNCGLINVNNSCYINTAIQCLRFCPSLYTIFEKEKDDKLYKYLSTNADKISRERILNANVYFNFKLLVETLNTRENINIRPLEYLKTNRELAKHKNMEYLLNEQNDIGEYLIFLLEAIHNAKSYTPIIEIKHKCEMKDTNTTEITIHTQIHNAYCKFKEIYKTKYSGIVREFNYMTINNVVCDNCKYNTYNYESNLILNVSINTHTTVEACINESLTNTINTWRCDKCALTGNAIVRTTLLNGPKTLIIMLNRFNENLRKNNKSIEPADNININQYVADGSRNNTYKLVAIANHYGSESCGHYTAMCFYNGIWQEYDDQRVRKINRSDIDGRSIYLLFYNKE